MAKYRIQRRLIFVLHTVVLVATVQAQNDDVGSRSNSDCTTPNGVAGVCTLISQCQPLWNLYNARPLAKESTKFLIASQCGTSRRLNDVKVCCAAIDHIDARIGSEPEPQLLSLRNNHNLPTDCGSDLSSRIVGGEVTELTEFPWMALLEYDTPSGKKTGCGGVLISSRYVLTAAHCVSSKVFPKTWSLDSVILGEYDTSTDRDCVPDGGDSEICSDPPKRVRIEEKMIHESYLPNSDDREHDVALLRLSQKVQFTNYVQPICLPANGNVAEKLWVAGWGKTETRSASNVKLKVSISPADKVACSQKYQKVGVNVGNNQICVGGQIGKDSCRGDSGGPLMSFETTPDAKRKWTVVGIISFGPDPCGKENWPGVYIKVADYMAWILTKIRA